MSIERCVTCRLWNRFEEHDGGFWLGTCDVEATSEEGMQDEQMYSYNDEPVVTGENFGCIHWEGDE